MAAALFLLPVTLPERWAGKLDAWQQDASTAHNVCQGGYGRRCGRDRGPNRRCLESRRVPRAFNIVLRVVVACTRVTWAQALLLLRR